MQSDPEYGWEPEFDKKVLNAIHFKSGVSIYFKTYSQNVHALQTGTLHAIFCDEELPENLYDELIFRITATDGYFHMVFTATLGQEFWRQVMEPDSKAEERFPQARKWCASLYDSQFYEDGTPSRWTPERIQNVKNKCKSDKEILKRVYGRFVMEGLEGLKYPQFNMKRHMKPAHPLPKDWLVWSAVDPGSGGTGHPAGILFMAVSPDYRKGRIFLGWRGDNIGDTTAEDVLDKHEELKKENRLTLIEQIYDPAAKDFNTLAERRGLSFSKANKDHTVGEEIVNVLFKNDMIAIHETDELQKLAAELIGLRKAILKRNAKDNLADPLRYLCVAIPWDWSGIGGEGVGDQPEGTRNEEFVDESKLSPVEREKLSIKRQVDERRKEMVSEHSMEEERIFDEIEEANRAYDY